MNASFNALKAAARACRECAADLPLGPRPVVRGEATARLLIIGQAPGTRVHHSGIPWNDPSGDRLRQWLGMDRDAFYDERRIAIVPMGLCYPGENPRGGDNPPRRECAPLWQDAFRAALPDLRLTLLVGRHAQQWHLSPAHGGPGMEKTSTATVAAWNACGPAFFPLPHPSWRNSAWIRKNPWFSDQVLPALRQRVRQIFQDDGDFLRPLAKD